VFNILSRNQDDHTKNLAFYMDRRGGWHLAPAYDLTYAYNPSGAWTHRHQMTLAGKRDDFTSSDLLEAASAANLKTPKAKTLIREVHEAVGSWKTFAGEAEVAPAWTRQIDHDLRLDLRA
jgi:serine/threonine-protein kinase HipA